LRLERGVFILNLTIGGVPPTRRIRLLAVCPLWWMGTLCFAPVAAAMDDDLREILVSAVRVGDQSLQSVPAAVTVQGTDSLEREGIESLADMARRLPGIAVLELGGGQNSIVIRGINSQGIPDPSNVETQPLVSVYLDDVPISLAGATPDLRVFDLQRIEVIRGPQGTLYGAGAMAGTIRYITQKPNTTEFGGTVETSAAATAGGAGSRSIRAMLNAPVIDDALALRVSVHDGRAGGYIDNLGTGVHDANWQDNTQVRAALRLDDGGPFTVDASYLYGSVRTGGHNDAYSGLGPFEFDDDTPEFYQDRLELFNVSAHFGAPAFDVLSSTSYVDRHITSVAGFQYGDAYYFGLPQTTRSSVNIDNRLEAFSQELRLSSQRTAPWKWQGGLYLEHQRRVEIIDIPTSGLDAALDINSLDYGAYEPNDQYSGRQTPTTLQLALFGEINYLPTEHWELIAGLRDFHWQQSFALYAGGISGALAPGEPETASGNGTENGVNPRFNASYHITSDSTVYVEAARGFRFGGINQPVPAGFCGAALAAQGLTGTPATYGPDHLWTYSLGQRLELDQRRLILNATAFYTRWSAVQTPHDLACGYTFVENAGGVRSTGLEWESRFRLSHALTVGFSASFTDALASGAIPDLDAPDGARVPYFPRTIATLDGAYELGLPTGHLALAADYNYRGEVGTEFDTASSLYRTIPATRVLNAAATWVIALTEWSLYAQNLTNGRIVSAISPNGYAPFQPGDALYLGRPRTIGLRAKVSF
jgi:outer membrane receptor protein involved in Fe transport